MRMKKQCTIVLMIALPILLFSQEEEKSYDFKSKQEFGDYLKRLNDQDQYELLDSFIIEYYNSNINFKNWPFTEVELMYPNSYFEFYILDYVDRPYLRERLEVLKPNYKYRLNILSSFEIYGWGSYSPTFSSSRWFGDTELAIENVIGRRQSIIIGVRHSIFQERIIMRNRDRISGLYNDKIEDLYGDKLSGFASGDSTFTLIRPPEARFSWHYVDLQLSYRIYLAEQAYLDNGFFEIGSFYNIPYTIKQNYSFFNRETLTNDNRKIDLINDRNNWGISIGFSTPYIELEYRQPFRKLYNDISSEEETLLSNINDKRFNLNRRGATFSIRLNLFQFNLHTSKRYAQKIPIIY